MAAHSCKKILFGDVLLDFGNGDGDDDERCETTTFMDQLHHIKLRRVVVVNEEQYLA